MEWKPCSGSGQPAIASGVMDPYKSMCPVCTKYVKVRIGQPVPEHDAVVINSQSIQREIRR